MPRRAWVPVCLAAWVSIAPARADGIAIVGGSPRSIGRAGASTVGDDGGGALLVNPAGIARRESRRLQLGLSFLDDSLAFRRASTVPVARDQAGSNLAPHVAAIAALGGWVVGAGMMTSAVASHEFRDPNDVPRPEDLGAAFDYRYHGIVGGIRRDTVTVGVARRFGDAVAFGISLAGSRIGVQETRRLWAGFGGISVIGDPKRDIQLAFDATDSFVPSAVAGVLIAPEQGSLELAASIGWSGRAELEGSVAANGTTGGPTVRTSSPNASLLMRTPITARVGVRYLADRFAIEVDGDLWIVRRRSGAISWTVDGVRVIDPSSVNVDLVGVPSRITQRNHGAVRVAGDVELIGDMNRVQRSKFWAMTNAQENEVEFHYCSSASTEIDRCVVFNYLEGHWTLRPSAARLCGADRGGVFVNPIKATSDGYLYDFETGYSWGGATPFLETGPIELGAGDRGMRVRRAIFDEKTSGDVNVYFKTRDWPGDSETTFGPYAAPNPVALHFSGRQVRVRVEFGEATASRIGPMRLGLVPAGKRVAA